MARQPLGHGDAGRHIHGIEQAQCKFGVVALLFERMRQFLDVKVGEHADQRRPHVDPVAESKMREIVEARQATAFHTRRSIATNQMIWITTLNPAR